MKTCTRCKVDKPFGDFSKMVRGIGGVRAACKECAKVTRAAYLAKNADKVKAAHFAYYERNRPKILAHAKEYAKTHKDQIQAWNQKNKKRRCEHVKASYRRHHAAVRARRNAAYQANREQMAAYFRERAQIRGNQAVKLAEWRAKNPERYQAQRKRWCKDNLLKIREKQIRREAKKRDTMVEKIDYQGIYRRDAGICHLCGETPEKYHFDHVIPLAKGGPHIASNIKVACATCNMKKGARLLAA